MPQTVPSAGFTPPCDYNAFAENFDLSLLPGGEQPCSTVTNLYPGQSDKFNVQPKIFATFYPSSPDSQSLASDNEFQPDFQTLLGDRKYDLSPRSPIHLEVPQPNSLGHLSGSVSPYSPNSQGLLSPNDQFVNYREQTFYPSSPEYSLYTGSPSSVYSKSPCGNEDYLGYIKKESTSPLPALSPFGIKEENYLPLSKEHSSPVSPAASSYSNVSSPADVHQVLFEPQKTIKQESTVDLTEILGDLQDSEALGGLFDQKVRAPEPPKDHQLLRQFLRDTSFQKKFNIHPIDFNFGDIKMEQEPNDTTDDLMMGCDEQISRESIEPVLNLAIEQMRKDVDDTCTLLGISPGEFLLDFYCGYDDDVSCWYLFHAQYQKPPIFPKLVHIT